MQKSILNSAVEKYYLGGLIETVKWVVKDKIVYIDFVSPNKDVVGRIVQSGFEMENCEIGIYNTTQLYKLIKIADKVITLTIDKKKGVSTEMYISDNQYDSLYYLSDTLMIEDFPEIELPSQPAMTIPIDDEFISRFATARKALGDSKSFTIGTGIDKALFTIGEKSKLTNKIKFEVGCEIHTPIEDTPFQLDFFTEILLANREQKGVINIYNEGIVNVEFKSEDKVTSSTSTYFLVKLQEV